MEQTGRLGKGALCKQRLFQEGPPPQKGTFESRPEGGEALSRVDEKDFGMRKKAASLARASLTLHPQPGGSRAHRPPPASSPPEQTLPHGFSVFRIAILLDA